MLPKSEAQRVIAISLGKIANYRSQRGGTSLHKNLLVANVLQKVRTYVAEDEQSVQWERQFERCTLSEVCEPMAVDDSKVSCDEISENISAKPNEEFPSVLPKTQATSECSNLIGSRVSCDTVNGSAISDVSMADYYSSTGPISTSAGEEEHSPDSVGLLSSTTHSTNDAKSSREMRLRARCLKRRQAIEDRDIVLVKRRRYDMETTDVNHTSPNLTSWRVSCVSSDCDSDVESDGLDVDQESSALSQGENTMDVEQICNLVSVFKCSFQGLGLIENPTVNNSETSTSSPTDYAFSNSQNLVQDLGNKKENKPPLRRGLSLPDLCAKQADMCQKFQLTAPVLALTV